MGSGVAGTAENTAGNTYSSSSSQFQSTLDSVKKKNSSGSGNSSRSSKSEEEASVSSSEEQINQCEFPDEESADENSSLMCSDTEDHDTLMSVMPEEPVKTLPEAQSRISENLKEAQVSDPDRSEAENELAAKDPVTYSFLQELNVDINPEQSGLSSSEKTIAEKNPLTFGLLQYNNIRVDSNSVGAPVVISNGTTIPLTEEQKQLFSNGNMSAFSNSLLANVKPDQHTQLLVAATGAARVDYTKNQVETLMAKGEDKEALEALRNNMDGAFSSVERDAVWKIAGEQHFTEDYFKKKIDEANVGYSASTRMHNVGDLLIDTADAAPAEVASVALDAVKNNYESSWLKGRVNARHRVYGASDGSSLYKGISALVERAPGRAADVASWMTDNNGGGNSLLNRLGNHDFKAVVHTAEEGHGIELSKAVNTNLKAAADLKPEEEGFLWNSDSDEMNRYEEFSEKFDEAKQEAGRQWYSEYAKNQFDSFNSDAIGNAQPFFDAMQGDNRIGNDVSVSSDTELRNIIGRSMGYMPGNESAALKSDYTQDWYAPGSEQRKNIDLIAGWIKQEGGEGLSVKSMPFIYASENAGVSKGALFEVTSKDGDKVVIDGSMADDVIAANKGETVSAEDDTDLPWKYDDVEEFFDDNLLDPDGKIYMAKGDGLADVDGDGSVDIQSRAAADTTTWEHVSPWVDTAVGVVGVVGGVVLAIPSGGTSLGISAGAATLMVGGSMAYGLVRSGQELHDMAGHGQEYMTLSNQRARGAWLGIVATGLGAGSLGATMRATNSMSQATRMLTTVNASSEVLKQGAGLMKHANLMANTAKTTGTAGAVIGFEQMGEQGYTLVNHWDEMSAQERALTFLNFSMGAADVGVGVYANRVQKQAAARLDGQHISIIQDGETTSNVHNMNAAMRIAQGEDIPAVYGRVEAGENGIKIFHPSDGSQPMEIVPLKSEEGADVQNQSGDKNAEDAKVSAEKQEQSVKEEGETGEIQVQEDLFDDISVHEELHEENTHGDVTQETADQKKSTESDEKIEDVHVFDFIPNTPPEKPKTSSLNRRLQDGTGDFLIKQVAGYQAKPMGDHLNTYMTRVRENQADGHTDNPNFIAAEFPHTSTTFKVDDATVKLSRVPGGLEEVSNDIHVHSMGYDRRSGEWFTALTVKAGENTRLLFGSIPQFCGGDVHYSTFSPSQSNLKRAQLLDDRVVSDFKKLFTTDKIVDPKTGEVLGTGIELAAKADLSLTGFDFSRVGKQDAVAYGRHHMLNDPGLFNFIGEVTGVKENVSKQLQDYAWDVNSRKFQDYLEFANETGQGVLLHHDWGKHRNDPTDGRPAGTKMNYEYFDDIVRVMGQEKYRDVNFVMAHTGIGRYVRPDDVMVTKEVVVKDLKGNIVEEKTVTTARHIHKLYEFFEKVPNARADISWNDVAQAYTDSPQLREGLVQFVVDNKDRLIFGSDTVKPETSAHYNQALNSGAGFMLDIARKDPGALKQLLRGNYDTVMSDAQTRVADWTRTELRKQGRHQDIVEMDKMHATLDYYRGKMTERADAAFDQWLGKVQEQDQGDYFETNRRAGVFPELYSTLPDSENQTWNNHNHDHGHDHVESFDGAGTGGGHNQESKTLRNKAILQSLLFGGGTVATASVVGAAVGAPSDVLNQGAFALRGSAEFAKLQASERFRQHWKDIFGRNNQDRIYRVSDETLNTFIDQVVKNQETLGFSDEKVLRVILASHQFKANLRYLEDKPINTKKGWTEDQKAYAITAKIGEFQVAIDRELGAGAASIDPLDARSPLGKGLNSLILGTLAVNDAHFAAWIAEAANGNVDISTPAGQSEAAFRVLFGLGNMVLTGHTAINMGGGQAKVTLVNRPFMKKLRALQMPLFAAGGAAWASTDAINTLNSIGANFSEGDVALGTVKTMLDLAFTYGATKVSGDEIGGVIGAQTRSERDRHNAKVILAGAMALRTMIGVGEYYMADEKQETEKQEEKPDGNK